MTGCLIDSDGAVWAVGSNELHRRFGYPSPDFDLVAYTVRNLGCVHITSARSTMRLRAHPGLVGRDTFYSVVRLMTAGDFKRFVFESDIAEWQTEIIGNLHDAVARLEDLLDEAASHLRPAGLVSEELSLGRLRHPKRAALRRLIMGWKRMRGRLYGNRLAPFQDAGILERAVLTRVHGNGRVLVEFFGPRLDVYDPDWNSRAIGLDLEDQPDPLYGESSARGYHDVRLAELPRFELVDSVIAAPGRASQRSRYERLVLPWTTADGSRFVSGASLLRTRLPIGIAR